MRAKIELQKQVKNKTFQEGVQEFILYCKSKNLRHATIKHYQNSVRVFEKFIPDDMKIKDITKKTVENFELYLKNNINENDVSMNTNVRSIRAVLYYFMK